jgi:lipoprotein-anchoring transpeptidase ErfK/SrfK
MLLAFTLSAIALTARIMSMAVTPVFAQAEDVPVAPEPVFDSSGSKVVYLDLSDQQALLTENGAVIAMYPISSGAAVTPTPRGEFQIHSKQELRISGRDLPYRMPHYMALTKDGEYGLHALPCLGNAATDSWYWQEAREHIGTPVSHGCVRLLPEDAEELFRWIDVGTPVFIRS